MPRRRPAAGAPIFGTVPLSTRNPDHLRVRKRRSLQVAGNLTQQVPENVESLEEYRPGIKTYRVAINFSGEAGAGISNLMAELNAGSPNEVVKRAVALLLSARGKEIILREPETGLVELVKA